MKRNICLLLCFCFCFCLVACAAPSVPEKTAGDEIPQQYREILENLIRAYPWNDDDLTMVAENPELSYLYRYSDSLSQIGFALMDLDSNGQAELILSDVSCPYIYDLYTIVDGKAVHLFDSGERYCHYLYENGSIENQWSGSAATNGHDFYELKDGALTFLDRITLDAYYALDIGLYDDLSKVDSENCFFRSHSDQFADYRSITAQEAEAVIASYQNATKKLTIAYTPLSEYQN